MILKRIYSRILLLVNAHIFRDPFALAIRQWFKDDGDNTRRLEYPLGTESIVFDVGGYQGDFSAAIRNRFGCKTYLFEPANAFFLSCCERFKADPEVICLNYGLGAKDGVLSIQIDGDASSFKKIGNAPTEEALVKNVVEVLKNLEVERISLIKMNIEGGEYDLLSSLIESGAIRNVDFIQVQFHNFVDGAEQMRDEIVRNLQKTHVRDWNYPFVWESWSRIGIHS